MEYKEKIFNCSDEFLEANGIDYSTNSTRCLEIPEGYTEVSLSINNDYLRSHIKEIKLPNTIKAIRAYSFCGFISLRKINLPEGLEIIEAGSFERCKNLKSIVIPDSVTFIGESVFYNCENLVSINIPNKLKDILKDTFTNCVKLNNIIIPENITSISNKVFNNCISLTNFNILSHNCELSIDTLINTNWHKIYLNLYANNEKLTTALRGIASYKCINRVINSEFIKFLNEINEDKNKVFKYVKDGILSTQEIQFLLGKEEYTGLTNGLNYGI